MKYNMLYETLPPLTSSMGANLITRLFKEKQKN